MKKMVAAIIGLLIVVFATASAYGQEYETKRARMVGTQLVHRSIADEALLEHEKHAASWNIRRIILNQERVYIHTLIRLGP